MTLDYIKTFLPDVPVCARGAVVERWRLTGRREPFARVYHPYKAGRSAEVAWSTIERVLNTPGAAVIL